MLGSCMKVEVAVLGSLSLMVRTADSGCKATLNSKRVGEEACGNQDCVLQCLFATE